MNKLSELRPNNKFKLNDKVTIGIHSELFYVIGFGYCESTSGNGGVLQNGHEFVRLKVPGSDKHFVIHCNFINLG